MKMRMRAAIAVLSIVTAGGAHAQTVRFEGAAAVYSSTGCGSDDPTGAEVTVRFRPGGIGSNPPDSGFSYLFGNGGYGLTVTGAITSAFKPASVTGVFDYGGPAPAQSIRFASQLPATIATTTPWLNIVGVIQNFDDVAGCTAAFRLGAVKRLN